MKYEIYCIYYAEGSTDTFNRPDEDLVTVFNIVCIITIIIINL